MYRIVYKNCTGLLADAAADAAAAAADCFTIMQRERFTSLS